MFKLELPTSPTLGQGLDPEPDAAPGQALSTWPALLLLAAGLVLTGLATRHTQQGLVAAARREFDFACHEIGFKVEDRLDDHEQILRSGAALFAATERVTRAEWRAFVQHLEVDHQWPGIQGIGYAMLLPPERLAAHIQEIRQEGFPDYKVWPEGERAVYSSIIYLEPFTNRNLRAFGYDMFSEIVRRTAMGRARDENTAALTGKVKLVQETSTGVQAGTLMFVPVYRQGMPVTTVAERRAALQGWVYSPYRMNDLMRGILGEWESLKGKRIRLQTFDGEKTSATELLYDSEAANESPLRPAAEFTLQTPITYAGRRWTLLFTQSSLPASASGYSGVWGVAAAGTALSLLLAGLVHALRNTRYNARWLARRLTADLQHTTERLALATEAGGVGIWDYNATTNMLIWDDQMFRLYGTTRARFSGAYEAWSAGLHPEDRQRVETEFQQALREEKEFNTEFRVLWPDGTVCHIHALARVQRNAAGQAVRMLGTNWDITEIQQAEEALAAETMRRRMLFEQSPDGCVILDPQTARFLEFNTAAHQQLGYSREEFAQLTIMDVEANETAAESRARIDEVVRCGKADFETRQRSRQGELRDVHVTAQIVRVLSRPVYYCIWRDITERKQIEKSLRESQLFLLETQRIARLAGWKANPHTDYLEWTAGVFEIIGSPETGQPGLEEGLKFFLPQYIPTLRESITRCLATSERFALECQGITGTGKTIWTEVRGLMPMIDRDHAYVMGTFQDITVRKQTETLLIESEANFRTFFESMTDMIVVGTPDGRILFTNAAVPRTLGYSPEELAGMRLLDLHPADRRSEAEIIVTAMFQGERSSCPLPLGRKDGGLVPAETRVWLGRWDGQNCIFGISKNLTAEQEAQQRFERLFRNNPAVMALSSLPDRRFTDVNDTFLQTLGYSRGDIIGQTTDDIALFVHPEQQVAVADILEADGRIVNFELQVRCKNGNILDGLFSGDVISSQGRNYFLTVMVDITERKRAEAELLRTLTAERELSALKSKFASMVSHEFRTPLSTILGASEMLEDFYDRLAPEIRVSYFQTIRRETQRLSGMLQDMLLQGQLEAGRMRFHPQSTDVVALCREVVVRVQTAFPKHPPLHFETTAPALRTLADEALLERVLSNLLTNAFKYSPALTPVRFSVRRVGDEWEMLVQDQGIGISEADQTTLFSAFRRGGNVGNVKGTGVGLYIVKKCAELHGGRVAFRSQAGQGSTFVFAFPWRPAETAPTEPL